MLLHLGVLELTETVLQFLQIVDKCALRSGVVQRAENLQRIPQFLASLAQIVQVARRRVGGDGSAGLDDALECTGDCRLRNRLDARACGPGRTRFSTSPVSSAASSPRHHRSRPPPTRQTRVSREPNATTERAPPAPRLAPQQGNRETGRAVTHPSPAPSPPRPTRRDRASRRRDRASASSGHQAISAQQRPRLPAQRAAHPASPSVPNERVAPRPAGRAETQCLYRQ